MPILYCVIFIVTKSNLVILPPPLLWTHDQSARMKSTSSGAVSSLQRSAYLKEPNVSPGR